MKKPKSVFITGASGLLGRSLVDRFLAGGYFVFAHYKKNKGPESKKCKWLYGDFSSIESINRFLQKNGKYLKGCEVLINNYGPITFKDTVMLKSSDFLSDFHGNIITVKEITDRMIKSGKVKTVVNIGFDGVGTVKPYNKILSYAIAKSGLQLLTLSYEREFESIKFFLVSPEAILGGDYGTQSGSYVSPDDVADEIFGKIVLGD